MWIQVKGAMDKKMGGVNTASNSLECRKTNPNYSVRVVLIVSCMQRRWSGCSTSYLHSDLGPYSWVMYSTIVLSLSKSCNWFQLAGFNTVDWSYLWTLTQLRLYCILATRIDRRDGWMARGWPYMYVSIISWRRALLLYSWIATGLSWKRFWQTAAADELGDSN